MTSKTGHSGDNKPKDYLNKKFEGDQKNKPTHKQTTFALTEWPLDAENADNVCHRIAKVIKTVSQ